MILDLTGIPVLHPDGRGVVLWVEGALGDAVTDPGHVLVPAQVGQVGVHHLVTRVVRVGAADVQTVTVT